PVGLVEAMFSGRATVSTDVGAVVEVIGGTGLVVPPRNPRALAEACVSLLRDPARRERLGAAARARALELFTVEQHIAAFNGLYLETVARTPLRRPSLDDTGGLLPFAVPAEAHVPGTWTAGRAPPPWARPAAARATATEAVRGAAGETSGNPVTRESRRRPTASAAPTPPAPPTTAPAGPAMQVAPAVPAGPVAQVVPARAAG